MDESFEHRPSLALLFGLVVGLSVALHPANVLATGIGVAAFRSRRSWCLILVGLIAGWSLRPDLNPPRILDRAPFEGIVEVTSMPRESYGRWSMDAVDTSGRRLLLVVEPWAASMGDRVAVVGEIGPNSEGSRAVGRSGVLSADSVEILQPGGWIWHVGLRARESFVTFVDQSSRPEAAEWMRSIAFNQTDGLDVEDWNALRLSGNVHIVSTSGLHVMLVAATLGLAAFRLPIPRPAGIVIVICALGLYAVAVGLRPPVLRATLVVSLMLLPYFFGREGDRVSILAFAAILELLWRPESVFTIGFQLSYLVSGALVLWLETVRGRIWMREPTLLESCVLPLRLAVVAWVVSMPTLAWHLGTVSVLTVFGNLLLMLAVVVIVAGSLALWVVSFVWEGLASSLLSLIVEPSVGWLLIIKDGFAALEWSRFSLPEFPFSLVLLSYVLLFSLYRFGPRYRRTDHMVSSRDRWSNLWT